MLKPLSPYIADATAHIFYYTQHMATVHYQNGKFHVHREVTDNVKKTEQDKQSQAPQKQNSVTDHINVKQLSLFNPAKISSEKNILPPSGLYHTCIAGDYPPPRI